jgi:DNA-binding NtrC family response regulator
LDVFPIQIAPLRERREDIPLLAEHIVVQLSQTSGQPLSLSPDAVAFLQQAELPGNARELHHRLTRASMHAADGMITASLLLSVERPSGTPARGTVRSLPTWKDATNAFQRQLLVDALRKTNRNLQEAAEMLGISRQHLSRLLHELNLNDHRPAHRGRKPRSEHGG